MLVRIIACKEREDNINKMLSTLPKKTETIWDTDHNSCHTICKALDSDEAMLIMEDDIELCENFYERAKKEIKKHENSFVMFYSCMSGEVKEAENKAKGLPYDRKFVYTQAYYLPAGRGKKLSKYLEKDKFANRHRYSVGINNFLIREGIDRYLVQPSLVQHIGFKSIGEKNRFVMHQSKTYKYEDDLSHKK